MHLVCCSISVLRGRETDTAVGSVVNEVESLEPGETVDEVET